MAGDGGSGSLVSVSTGEVALDVMRNEIRDIIAYTRGYADEMRTTLSTAIENLEEVVSSYHVTVSNIDTNIPWADRPNFPIRPTFGDLNLSNYPDSYIPEPVFKEYGLLDYDYETPQTPTEVESNFNWVATNYTSDMWQILFAKVHNALLNDSYGLSDDVHAAEIAREQRIRKINQDREFQVGLTTVGATGWNLPGGHYQEFLQDFQDKVIREDQNALDNITKISFDIALDLKKFYLTAAADLEKVLRDTFDKAENISLEAAKAVAEYLWKFKELNIRIFLGKWEGIKTKFEALRVKADSIANWNESETKIYVARTQALDSRFKAISEENRGKLDSRKSEVEIYATEVDAISKEYIALVEDVKTHQEAVKARIDRELKVEELEVTAFAEKTKVAVAVATGIANIGSQGVASALGAINTNLSNSYSGNEGRSEAVSVQAELQETHSWKE